MKKIKLFLAACAAMVTMGVNAQSWIASEVGAGNFHLYNVGKGQFLTRNNGWQTQASTGADALTLIVEEYNGAYKLRTDVNGSGKGLERLADPVIYTDQSNGKNSTWTFTKVADGSNGPIYTIVSADNHNGGAGSYMTASADNTIVGPADAVTDDYGRWQLVQSWITNTMPVINADGWTVSQTPAYDAGNICAEYWNKSGASIKQTVSDLPAGSYELISVALTREGMTATLYAGTNTMSIATVGSGTVNNRTQAKSWFDEGNGVNKLEFTHGGGNLEIGLIADNANGDHWLVWRSFVLLYKGLDLSEFAASLAAAVDAAEAVEGTVPTAAYNALAAVVAANNQTYTTTDEYTAATNAIVEATNTAKALQANYARYNTVKAAALTIAASLDTTTPDAAFDAATTNDAIEAALASLRAAFLAELPNVTVPTDPGYIDVTAVMVDNAGVRQNTDYWTSYMYPSSPNGGSFAKCSNNECEFYQQNFKFYQTLALTPGTWEFGVSGFHRAGNHNTHFYAGDDKILIPGVSSEVVNTMAAAETYFNEGNGKVALKFLIETAGDVEIGIDNQDTETDKWTIFRDFTLKYYGAPDYTVYENQWTELVGQANTAKTNNANVTGTELTSLNTAIADSPAGSNNKATYNEKISALQTALQTFNAAAPSYDAYVAYKAETISLWGSDLGVAAPTTAAGAVTAVQNLNIAQYNKVDSDYTFSATGVIGDFGSWTGTATVAGEAAAPNYLQNEHWSGQTHAYYEQAASGWANANGWTIKYEKTCTLPAGDYVIKVAARSSVDVTSSVSCTATSTTISLPKAGNRTRGINTTGVASWSDSDTFIFGDPDNVNVITAAVGGRGGGWEWRFLPFTLDAEGEVTMTFYAETSKQYNWMSISDAELLSTTKVAQDVTYNENETNTITNTIVADVTMTRTIKIGYNTVCLPFTLTANQVTDAFGAGAKVYNYSEDSTDPNSVTFDFTEGDGSITANVPVIVKATETGSSQTFNGVQIVAASEAKVEGTNFDYVGVYNTTNLAFGDYFIATQNDEQKIFQSQGIAGSEDTVKGFRAYFQKKNAAPVKAYLYIDGVATSISEINGDDSKADATIFNLAGQRVNKAQRGIYIVNGKKVAVK